MYRTAMISGALFAALGVILGAFGAHALKAVLSPELQQTFETGVKYQMYHSFALLVTGVAYQYRPLKMLKRATACFITGIILFSGSLYILAALKAGGQVGLGGFGMLTPIGGVFFIIGWLMLALSFIQKK